MPRVVEPEVEAGPPGDREEIAARIVRLIEETHRAVLLQNRMLLDLYNIVFYNLKPRSAAVPPNPNAVPVRPAGVGVEAAGDVLKALESLGGVFGRIRRRT